MLPEEKARVKIDKQLNNAGWSIVAREEYIPGATTAVKEALMKGNKESDYLLFIDNKAIAVVEAKREENPLDESVEKQAEHYAVTPQGWYGTWFANKIPLVYLANGNKIYFKNLLVEDSDYVEISQMHSPKKMLKMLGLNSNYGALPMLEKRGLRDCQYNAEISLENSLKAGNKKSLAILATGSGKTYLACLASYRMLNYTTTNRVLFLVDRNNLARQTESEFSMFDRTEKQQTLSALYQIKRLRHEEDINGDIVISTIQKLFAVLTGQQLVDDDEDAEDDKNVDYDKPDDQKPVELGNDIKIPSDYFQFIVVDECHRSIYGKWRAVLDYFSDAKILGLTATPTPEALAFFNNNIVEKYTYDDSVVDGVNVPSRIFRIATNVTEHGGTISKGETITEKSKRTGESEDVTATSTVEYAPTVLDRTIINRDQIRKVLMAYKNAIYTELYPDRDAKWEYIPKTLIFAKNDNHASEIVEVAKEVFAEEFGGVTPDKFVQKITYSAGDSNALIRDLRVEKDFRIAVTVTLVATGTDVKPLEVVLFMKDVMSDVLYTQMKGRGCRVINDDKLKEVTPNAESKDCYYIVDAVGVTEHDKIIPPGGGGGKGGHCVLSLEVLLEHLAHNEVSDENLSLLRDYCATIHKKYEDNPLFGRHLDYFISNFGFSPRKLANDINSALESGILVEYISPSHDNSVRMGLIYCLLGNLNARNKLLEMQKGYYVESAQEDEVIYAGFSKEQAQDFIDNFEKYCDDNKDSVEALRIIYNSEDTLITHAMLIDLRDKFVSANRQFRLDKIWQNYKALDESGNVEELDVKTNAKALTNLIQLVRYAYKKSTKLISLQTGYAQRFNLFCGRAQRVLTDDQKAIMQAIADYIINDGSITMTELNEIDADLWRRGVMSFGPADFNTEIQVLSKFILRVA
ncbi:MAG: DEAD/DEAH box helicase family protein [Clostridia bacterium]|nr:DEAD/DEAH box helicase family protein [Clostridia bacterium]